MITHPERKEVTGDEFVFGLTQNALQSGHVRIGELQQILWRPSSLQDDDSQQRSERSEYVVSVQVQAGLDVLSEQRIGRIERVVRRVLVAKISHDRSTFSERHAIVY